MLACPPTCVSPLSLFAQTGWPQSAFIVEPLPPVVPVKPHRPLGRPALSRLVSTRNLTLTLLRNEGLATLLVINRYFGELYDEETRAEAEGREPDLPEFPAEEMRQAVRRGAINAATDWAVQATRAGLDYLAHLKLDPDLSERLLKDLRSSAVRKTKRMPWHVRAARITRTALFSESTLFAADVVVSSVMEAVRACRGVGPYSPAAFALYDPAHPALAAAALATPASSPLVPVAAVHAPIAERLLRLLSRAALHLARGCVALCAVALANGIAWAMPAARGTLAFAGTQGASVLANLVMARVMEKVLTRQVLACQRKRAGKGAGGAGAGEADAATTTPAPAADAGPVDAALSADAASLAPPDQTPALAPASRPARLVAPEPLGDLSGAEAPPVPTPQQRRPAGPRLPERPPRRATAQRPAAAPTTPAASAPAPATPPSREDRPTLPGSEGGRPWDGAESAAAVAARVAERAVAAAVLHAQRVAASERLPAPIARDPSDDQPADETVAPTSLAAAFISGADASSP